MKNLLIFISLLCLAFSTNAAVYKHVDEHGNLIKYSDQPQKPGDKPLDLPKPAATSESQEQPRLRFTPVKPKESTGESQPVVTYAAVAIIKPENEESIRANGGMFPIELASQPELDATAGHRYVIVVDGEKHQESPVAKFNLINMDRGAHSISAEIHDKDDKVLTSSSSITVYVLRASVH